MVLSLIIAAAENSVIGKSGQMPWRLPAELAYFKKVTLGHPVITGRKNYEAIGRPLPGRLNIVITRQPDYRVPDGVIVVHSFDEALALQKVQSASETFVIGGQQIYQQALPLANKLYLTNVHTKIAGGDAFFRYDPDEWKLVWSREYPADGENKFGFTLKRLKRR